MEATMLTRLALISTVSAFALGTALAQAPDRPATSPSTPPAASQQAPKADTPKAEMPKADMKAGDAKFVSSQKPDQFLASKFKGTDVLGTDNQKIGDVSDILFDKSGKIDAYVISVGGFLGMGSKEVALAPDSFQVMPGDPNSATDSAPKLKLSMTKDQLTQAANFEPYKAPRTTTGAGGGAGTRPGGMGGGGMK
jgi:hypothetical protein